MQMAIASLEGKLDDEPMDESLKPVMGPLCDAAAMRIQAFYQAKSHSDAIPASDLVMQTMKYKIKPLVSSSTIKGADREGAALQEYIGGYLKKAPAKRAAAKKSPARKKAPAKKKAPARKKPAAKKRSPAKKAPRKAAAKQPKQSLGTFGDLFSGIQLPKG